MSAIGSIPAQGTQSWYAYAQSLDTAVRELQTAAGVVAGTTLTVVKSGSTWPARPTDRADVIVAWKGPDPSPNIVTSGTAGMRDGVDLRFVTP